ncbi:bifunctional riboflavin kinase/FAD synthetase [Hyphomicrobium sp. D-2]|uniref:bifunctional riboflavin kinase/FAD synthetase n=1 Tax=Hyphomicrobium sp. D-2 TaxID=3041621 RepID=UPI0024570DBF|nr:bifunctional riboflavin kinase/FAD synthetase [Hyphomicrobium sp. D-2]MDH4982354.1 bifunctional riboflavin kinase/FAD synthetase [Hyphomicrobium sp. D-2]
MLVVQGYKDVPANARGAVLTIGNFDGVHRGHQALLHKAVEIAQEIGAPAGALIFEPYPREFFEPKEPIFRLTTLPAKIALFNRIGLDLTVVLNFDQAMADLSADDFVKQVLVEGLGVRHVIVGHNFFFGCRRIGTPETLRAAGERYGFGVTIISPVAEHGEVFSSSNIRLRITQGDVKGAARRLGRNWSVIGQVVGGAKRGTGLGFPTANIPLAKGNTLGHGIYAVRVHFEGAHYDGAAYLGTRPTYDNGKPVLEVFLLNFDGDLYGHTIEVEFVDFIRPDRKFDSSEELVSQMQEDIARVQAILATGSA